MKVEDMVVVYSPNKRKNPEIKNIVDIDSFYTVGDDEWCDIYTPVIGISPVRKWILDYHRKHYPNKMMMQIDDDVSKLERCYLGTDNKIKHNKIKLSELILELIKDKGNAPAISPQLYCYKPSLSLQNSCRLYSCVLVDTNMVLKSNYAPINIICEDFLFAIDCSIETGYRTILDGNLRFYADSKISKSTYRNAYNSMIPKQSFDYLNNKYTGIVSLEENTYYGIKIHHNIANKILKEKNVISSIKK
jgi:hypothetical protein